MGDTIGYSAKLKNAWMGQLIAAVGVLAAANVLVGWLVGYTDPGNYLVFWTQFLILVAAAWIVTGRLFDCRHLADTVVRTAVAAFALIVLCAFVLGVAKHLTAGWFLLAETVCLAAALRLPARRTAVLVPVALPAISVPVVAVGGAIVVFGAAFAVWYAPLTLYDSISYHLFFSARWLQDQALSIVPTPFSDEAQAYAPANGELFFLGLMLPFHGDLLARAGELPFALLAAVAIYALGRRAGAPPDRALYPAAFFLLARPVFEQAVGADVDIVCSAMFLTSLYLGSVALDTDFVRDWAIWGVSLGLFFGSKYAALVYAPVFLLLAVARGVRGRVLWALPGVAAFGAPWYLRTWIAAGSPIYPASLALGGFVIAHGAFARGAMLNSVFHVSDPRLLPIIAAHAFGPTLFVLWLPAAIVGTVSLFRQGWWPSGFVALVPIVMIPLFWFGFPVNIDSRFLMPALGPALVPLAFTFGKGRMRVRAVHAIYVLALVWIAVGTAAQAHPTVPWFMQDWLTFDGLITRRFLPWFALVAVAIGGTWWTLRSRPGVQLAATVSLSVVCATVLAAIGANWCAPARCEYVDVTSPRIRPNLLNAWRWVAEHTHDATIAYTGINLPYPLTGDQLTNRVVYANIDGRPRWRFHDYDKAYRRGDFDPTPPLLATSSGELRSVAAGAGPRADAVRPRYERMEGLEYAWISNLRQMHVTYLFVSSLSAYEVNYVWHNERDYPIEDEWAKRQPRVFTLVYENRQVRIYAVDASDITVIHESAS